MLVYLTSQTDGEGGHTIFSLSAIKVVPRKRRMLFFGYKLRDGNARGATEAMDGGLSEHAGCPIRRGTKVVLTQWLREAVTAERDWRHYARLDGEETFRNAVTRTPPPPRGPSPSPPPLPSSLPSPQCEQPLTLTKPASHRPGGLETEGADLLRHALITVAAVAGITCQ